MTDICDTTYFEAAPVLSPVGLTYYINQGDLDILATYDEDEVTRTTETTCGYYSI